MITKNCKSSKIPQVTLRFCTQQLTVINKDVRATACPLISLHTGRVYGIGGSKIDWNKGRGRAVPSLLLQQLIVLRFAPGQHSYLGSGFQLRWSRDEYGATGKYVGGWQ